MQLRKLDMGKAWTQATGLIGTNRETLSAIAGLFYFLPAFAGGVFIPDLPAPPAAGATGADPEVALRMLVEQVGAIYSQYWPLILALSIVQLVGSMALLALLTDRGNPTVGEALKTGVRAVPTYVASQLIVALAFGLGSAVILTGLGLVAPPAIAAVAGLAMVVVLLWAVIRLSLTGPVIAIEGVLNPLAALRRSWQLTKGNSLRILLFGFLLLFTIGIIAALVSGILGLVLSAFGEPVASIGIDMVSALINSLIAVIFQVVIVAIHRQLAGPSTEALTEPFV